MTHVCLLARRSKSINKRKPNLIRKRANELQTHFSLTAKPEVSGYSALVQSSGLGVKLPSELQLQQWSGCLWPSPHQPAPVTGNHPAPWSNHHLYRLPQALEQMGLLITDLSGAPGNPNCFLCLESWGLLSCQTGVGSANSVSHRCCGKQKAATSNFCH